MDEKAKAFKDVVAESFSYGCDRVPVSAHYSQVSDQYRKDSILTLRVSRVRR